MVSIFSNNKAYLSSNCHVHIVAEKRAEMVKKAKVEQKDAPAQGQVKLRNPKKAIRKSLAKAYRQHKFVEVSVPPQKK